MKRKKNTKDNGFTMVELVVVLAILAVLLTPGIFALQKYTEKAQEQSLIVDCRYAVLGYYTLSMEKYARSERLIIRRSELAGLLELPGKVTEWETNNMVIIHLCYEYNGKSVEYCQDYQNCKEHKKEYTVKQQHKEAKMQRKDLKRKEVTDQ